MLRKEDIKQNNKQQWKGCFENLFSFPFLEICITFIERGKKTNTNLKTIKLVVVA